MDHRFNEGDAAALAERFPDLPRDLARRVYTTRLLGLDRELVLHGGGNTSVKLKEKDLFGRDIEVLYVKGSGRNMAFIDPSDFTRLDLARLRKLAELDHLSDQDMENQLQVTKLFARDPGPSVDTLAHVFLPHRFIDHTHADSILILTNQANGENIVRQALGPKVSVLPYVRPGFPLAKRLAELHALEPEAEAVVVMGHGIFTFGPDALTAYDRMIEYVGRAEDSIERAIKAGNPAVAAEGPAPEVAGVAWIAQALRGACAPETGDECRRRFLVEFRSSPELRAASRCPQAGDMCRSGVLTPDHAIRTKNRLLFIEETPAGDPAGHEELRARVREYGAEYGRYFRKFADAAGFSGPSLDPFPRAVLVSGVGLFTLGRTRGDAIIAADIAEQTILAKHRALAVGDYEPLGEDHIFDLEYWGLQQRKIARDAEPPLMGQAALVTGGGGAIALGVADRLLEAGAAVVLTDLDEARLAGVKGRLALRHSPEMIETIVFDVTDFQATARTVDEVCARLGGLDIVVPNAGVAHVDTIEDLEPEALDRVVAVNLKGTFNVIKAVVPVFRRQGTGGNIVIISSKNVFDPGASFAAYSASKAGAHQIGKIAALELAEIGVRVNMINPDAIFGDKEISSKLWDLVGPDRMRCRGLDPDCIQDYYRDRNLLKARVFAEHVGAAVVFFASDQTPTTGASLPVDGGVQGAFPR